jgi:hypothetical protein
MPWQGRASHSCPARLAGRSPAFPGTNSSLKDGGVVDRIGLKAWRNRRRRHTNAAAPHSSSSSGGGGGGSLTGGTKRGPAAGRPPPCLVHIIERSSPFSGADDPAATGESEVHVVRSPKSGVNFFDLGDFDQQFDAARRRARPVLEQLIVRAAPPGGPASTGAAAGSLLAQPKAGGPGANFSPANSPLRPAAPGLAGRGVVVARRAAGGGVGGSAAAGGPSSSSAAGSP